MTAAITDVNTMHISPNAIQDWNGKHDHRIGHKTRLRVQAYFQWGPKTTKRWLWTRRTQGQKLNKRKTKQNKQTNKKGHGKKSTHVQNPQIPISKQHLNLFWILACCLWSVCEVEGYSILRLHYSKKKTWNQYLWLLVWKKKNRITPTLCCRAGDWRSWDTDPCVYLFRTHKNTHRNIAIVSDESIMHQCMELMFSSSIVNCELNWVQMLCEVIHFRAIYNHHNI